MAKCQITVCKNQAVGGFEEEYGNKLYVAWCAVHERDMRENVKPPGHYLTREQLRKLP